MNAQSLTPTLRELPLPAPVPYTPQTVGWLIVALILLAIAMLFAWRAWRRHECARYRREALAELAMIETKLKKQDIAALAEIAPLIKRTALAAAPRAQIASLSGAAWIAFLRRTHNTFDDEDATLLYTSTYAPRDHLNAVSQNQAQRLVHAAREWIEHHHVEV